MLLSFSIGNFRSFKDEQTLSLIASKRLGDANALPHCAAVPGTDETVLRVAALYGANGAGKSNLVRALGLVERLVLRGTPPGKRISFEPFLLEKETQEKPSCFELQFVQEGKVFRYGFCCDAERVHEEWLVFYEGRKERPVFTRVPSDKGAAQVELAVTADKADFPDRLKALAAVGARPNQLFLTEVVNLDDAASQGSLCKQAIAWFSSTLSIIEVGARFEMLAETLATDESFADFAGKFLCEANTGIAGLSVQTKDVPRSKVSTLPPEVWTQVDEDLSDGHVTLLSGPDGVELFVDGSDKNTVKIRQITALHNAADGDNVTFPIHEESDGSRQLLNLLPALYRLKTAGGVFVIDEIERSMHPILARKFVEFFLRATRESNSQIIFTTHESTLLDLELLRRDGIWFTEKDETGATRLYSLAEFKVRNDLRIDKGYLQGRFGAIPFLGGIDHLIEDASRTEDHP
jgi:AAA15 family ATPase/GTPase